LKKQKIFTSLLLSLCASFFVFFTSSLSQEPQEPESKAKVPDQATQVPIQGLTPSSDNVTLDFKEADIQNVLKVLSYKSGMNIVSTPDVLGNVTIRLVDVPWEIALDVILKTYGYSYQKQGNIILVGKMENMNKLQADEPLQTDIFTLKFLDAQDAAKIISPCLPPAERYRYCMPEGRRVGNSGPLR